MTDFTDEQIESLRRHAAEKVAGWHKSVIEPAGIEYWMQGRNPESLRMRVEDWRPDEDANQALMLLEAMKHWTCDRIADKYQFYALPVDPSLSGYLTRERYRSFGMGALIAVCRATGWQE